MCFSKLFGLSKPPHPSDWVKEEAIKYDPAEGILHIDLRPPMLNVPVRTNPTLWWPGIPNTGSMLPVFGKGNNNLLVKWEDKDDQKAALDFAKEGDIAVYRTDKFYAIHRIKKKVVDIIRRWTFRGDNNPTDDPEKVSDEHMQRISFGTIY